MKKEAILVIVILIIILGFVSLQYKQTNENETIEDENDLTGKPIRYQNRINAQIEYEIEEELNQIDFTPKPLDINDASLLALYRFKDNKEETGRFPIAEIHGNITYQTGPNKYFNASMFTPSDDGNNSWLWIDNENTPFRHRIKDEKESEDSEFSLSFWLAVNTTTGQGTEDDFIFYTKGNEGWFRVWLEPRTTIMRWQVRTDFGAKMKRFNYPCKENQWCHWAATFNNKTDMIKIFHNGKNIANITDVEDMDGRAGKMQRTGQCRGMSFMSMRNFGRNAGAGMTDLAWFNRTLADKEVYNIFRYGKLK